MFSQFDTGEIRRPRSANTLVDQRRLPRKAVRTADQNETKKKKKKNERNSKGIEHTTHTHTHTHTHGTTSRARETTRARDADRAGARARSTIDVRSAAEPPPLLFVAFTDDNGVDAAYVVDVLFALLVVVAVGGSFHAASPPQAVDGA
jgi:hypothetical protein